MPAAIDAASPSATAVCAALKPSIFDAAAAAAKVPIVPEVWKPFM